MAATNKSVKKNGNGNAVAVLDESMFEADAGLGLENVTSEDLALPFLKVLSRQDPILDDLDTAKAGDIYNTVTSKVYPGKEGVLVIPCAFQKRFIQWAPRGAGSGAPLGIFGPAETRPSTERSAEDNKDYVVGGTGDYIEQTAQHYVLLLSKEGSERALVAMKSTQLKKSRKWMSMILSRQMQGKNGLPFTPPMFSHVYRLTTVSQENAKGSWHGWEVALEGKVQEINMYHAAKVFGESVDSGQVNVKHQQDAPTNAGLDDSVPF